MIGSYPIGGAPIGAVPSSAPIALTASDSLAVVPTSSVYLLPYLHDTFNLNATTAASMHAFNTVVATFNMQDAALVAWSLFATSSAAFSTVSANTRIIVLAAIDILVATGIVPTRMDAIEAVTDAFAAQTIAEAKFFVGATDTIAFSDIVNNALLFAKQAVDSIVFSDATVSTAHFVLLAATSFASATTAASHMTMTEQLAASIGMFVNVRLDTGEFSGWVLNAEGRGVTEYTNYEFNSFAPAYGSCFGGSDEGLFELVGGDDAGTPIDAWIRSALTNLGSDVLKNAPAMYVGLTAEDSLVLKVIVSNDPAIGGKREFWYTSPPKAAASSQGTRFEPGKGLEGVYWQWELHNQDGADFSINVVSWYPVLYTRRV